MQRADASSLATSTDVAQASKPKRTRTGCLTCRERHLKCDEGSPECRNCAKSNRTCVYGVRLNFIDIRCQQPPVLLPRARDWKVIIQDESREIASEYRGGLAQYSKLKQSSPLKHRPTISYDFASTSASLRRSASHALPPIHGMMSDSGYHQDHLGTSFAPHRVSHHHHSNSHSDEGYGSSTMPMTGSSYTQTDPLHSPFSNFFRPCLTDQTELLYMMVFIEEVGLWMDSLNEQKHFSRLLPFKSMREPMLMNAFLACGARHLSLINPNHSEERALHYYDTATRHLLHALEDPSRDTVTCATTAVILNVYEIMCERALQRMNHIAGARALIKECGWNAKSTGIGAACFWLNVGMELLSCLHFNWQVAWDPDDWGIDANFHEETEDHREELWTHRIMYIVGKIANFRASGTVYNNDVHQHGSPRTEQMRLQQRYAEWRQLLDWASRWYECIPVTMHPLGYLEPHQTQSGSAFPEVYLGVNRTTTVARLFYHTAMVLLAQTNPYPKSDAEEMDRMQKYHSTLICGIVAHTKDRGVASVALRSLAIAAECLTKRNEQEEVLAIFERIRKETGWRVGYVHRDLPVKWGWPDVSMTPPASSGSNDGFGGVPASSSSQTMAPSHNRASSMGGSSTGSLHAAAHQAHRLAQLHANTPMPTPPSMQPFTHQPPSMQPSYSSHPHHSHSNSQSSLQGALLTQPQAQHGQGSQVQMSHMHHQQPNTSHSRASSMSMSQPQQTTPHAQRRATMPVGIPNPLLAGADFGMPSHPYQNHYVAPNVTSGTASMIGGGLGGFGY